MLHFASAVFGIMVLHSVLRLAFLYMMIPMALAYLLLVLLAARGRHLSGVAVSVMMVIFVVVW